MVEVKIGKNNKIVVRVELKKFLVSCLIFLLVIGWVFSGWPRIWQEPAVPSEVKTVKANPDTEIKKPTSHTDGTGWTTPAQAYDSTSTANDQTTEGNDTSMKGDPAITFHTWASKVETYTATVLKVNWKTNGSFSDDQFAIQYMKDGSNWLNLVALDIHNETTIQTSSTSLDADQDLTLVQVKVVATRSGSPDGGTLYIYDIWTEGEYFIPSVSISISPTSTDYGAMDISEVKKADTANADDEFIVTNTGNVAEDFDIISSDATGDSGWTLSTTSVGSSIFMHAYSALKTLEATTSLGSTGEQDTKWVALDKDPSYKTLATNVPATSGTADLVLELLTPSEMGDYVQKSITVTVRATEH